MEEIIQAGGGVMIWDEDTLTSGQETLLPFAIRLISEAETLMVNKNGKAIENAFSMKYIYDCVKNNCILQNLIDYAVKVSS